MIVDASAIVGLLDPSDIHHAAANRDLAEGPLSITRGTLAETARTLRRRANKVGVDGAGIARTALAELLKLPGVSEAPSVPLDEVMRLHVRHKALSFEDAWNLAVALRHNLPLVTYDKDLLAAHRRETRPASS